MDKYTENTHISAQYNNEQATSEKIKNELIHTVNVEIDYCTESKMETSMLENPTQLQNEKYTNTQIKVFN